MNNLIISRLLSSSKEATPDRQARWSRTHGANALTPVCSYQHAALNRHTYGNSRILRILSTLIVIIFVSAQPESVDQPANGLRVMVFRLPQNPIRQ
jgi:hypothetical protein